MTHVWIVAWGVGLALLAAFAAQPVGIEAQGAFAATGLAAMVLIRLFRGRGVHDHVFMAIAAAIFFRYLAWRVTETLPPPERPLDLALGLMLLLAEIYAIGMLALNFFVVADPIEQPEAPLLGDEGEWPTVDVMVPSYDEDLDIVGVTLAAARNLDYPADRLRVWLLDDGATEQKMAHPDPARARAARERGAAMRAFCDELGVGYLARGRNERAKAGNLNAGLAATDGDLVLVLDADHVPAPDFLRRTVGHFQRDPKLFLVQTPHHFLNADPAERNLGMGRMPAESEMFYSVIQRGLDKWNATFFCGSAAVLRRVALEETGGFSGETVTEDCETALQLHQRGWTSRYVDRAMVGGLQPDTFAAWIGQRTRWASGMVQVLLLKNPLAAKGLSVPQRLGYLSSSLFWLFPFSRLAFLLAPTAFLLFDMRIYEAAPREIAAFTVASLLAGILVQARLYGRVRWPWMSEVYETVQSPHLAAAVLGVVRRPRAPSFNVTAKGETIDTDRLSSVAAPVIALFAVLLATAIAGIVRVASTGGAETLVTLVTGWSVFNLAIGAVCLGAVSERRERRRHPRMPLDREGVLLIDGEPRAVRLIDGSTGGLRVAPIAPDTALTAASDRTGTLRVMPRGTPAAPVVEAMAAAMAAVGPAACRPRGHALPVRLAAVSPGSDGASLGLAFGALGALDRRFVAAVLFPHSDEIERRRRLRQRAKPVPLGTLALLGLGPLHGGRALGHVARMAPRLARRLALGPARARRRRPPATAAV